ncbi:MAG: hypothetical protein K2Y05_12710, partial [Hyphomicrobiaceae bacterium]|nr:hypothetical protein [Hyphomicrobiaceae bacterium]
MSIDQIHHTAIGTVVADNAKLLNLYQTLYPGQGKAFGFKADFSDKLSSEAYRKAYFAGETRALLRLPASGHVLPGLPNASTHSFHPILNAAFKDYMLGVAADLDANYVPPELQGQLTALEYAQSRERAIRISTALDLVNGDLIISRTDPRLAGLSETAADARLLSSAQTAFQKAGLIGGQELLNIHNNTGGLLDAARPHAIYSNPLPQMYLSVERSLAQLPPSVLSSVNRLGTAATALDLALSGYDTYDALRYGDTLGAAQALSGFVGRAAGGFAGFVGFGAAGTTAGPWGTLGLGVVGAGVGASYADNIVRGYFDSLLDDPIPVDERLDALRYIVRPGDRPLTEAEIEAQRTSFEQVYDREFAAVTDRHAVKLQAVLRKNLAAASELVDRDADAYASELYDKTNSAPVLFVNSELPPSADDVAAFNDQLAEYQHTKQDRIGDYAALVRFRQAQAAEYLTTVAAGITAADLARYGSLDQAIAAKVATQFRTERMEGLEAATGRPQSVVNQQADSFAWIAAPDDGLDLFYKYTLTGGLGSAEPVESYPGGPGVHVEISRLSTGDFVRSYYDTSDESGVPLKVEFVGTDPYGPAKGQVVVDSYGRATVTTTLTSNGVGKTYQFSSAGRLNWLAETRSGQTVSLAHYDAQGTLLSWRSSPAYVDIPITSIGNNSLSISFPRYGEATVVPGVALTWNGPALDLTRLSSATPVGGFNGTVGGYDVNTLTYVGPGGQPVLEVAQYNVLPGTSADPTAPPAKTFFTVTQPAEDGPGFSFNAFTLYDGTAAGAGGTAGSTHIGGGTILADGTIVGEVRTGGGTGSGATTPVVVRKSAVNADGTIDFSEGMAEFNEIANKVVADNYDTMAAAAQRAYEAQNFANSVVSLGGSIGTAFGSSLGNIIGGDNVFAQIGASTVLGA